MAEYFPGYTPEASSEDDDDSTESVEKKTSKKAERSGSKESGVDNKAEKREREDAVPLEKLADDETSVIAAELARLRAEATQQELVAAVDGSIEQTEAIPVVEFDEALQRNLEDGQSFDEALENAEATATELIGEELDVDGDEDTPEDEPAEAEDDNESDEEDATTTQGSRVGSSTNPPKPTAGGSSGTPPNAPGGTGGGAGAANPGGQGAGGGVPPHTPAGPPPNQAPPGGPGGPGGMGPNAYYNPNTAPAAANVAPDQAEEKSVAPYLLAGGLVGYLVGRRRGRIKTERRLLPVQKKLEKQVTNLEKQIVLKEEKIRNLTRKQAEAQPALQAAMVERKQMQQAKRAEKQRSIEVEKTTETVVLQQKRAASERLGKLAFRQETISTQIAEQRVKPVERMTKPELLAIAERIKVEQGDVKRLYETGRIDDKGLRRVLEAYLSGQSYERVLRDQLRSSEVQGIESDPIKVSEQPRQNSTGGGISSSSSYQNMTGYQPVADENNPMSSQQSNIYSSPNQTTTSYASPKNSNTKRNVGVTIVVIVAVVILLLALF